MEEYGIKSNNSAKQFKQLYISATISKLLKIFERIFEAQIFERLEELSQKHPSAWSRELVTVVLDDSVFKQWLSSFSSGQDYEKCYANFFSGQTRSSVYGFKVACLGICIDGIYYPLYFEFVSKKSKEDNGGKSTAIQAAEQLIKRYAKWKKACKDKGLEVPKLHFSCDNGYSDVDLANCCEKENLIYISVPTKSHLFEIDVVKIKLQDWIEQTYLQAEKAHEEAQAELPEEQRTDYVHRFKGTYLSKKMRVTMIAFRLNGSKKVSIVYTNNYTIFGKTLRRQWFQRTYIEQFFKILKHVLKIQESRIRNKDEFTFKLLRFTFMAWHVQQMIRFIRRKMKVFGNKGFIFLQRALRKDPFFDPLLQNLIAAKN
ncbi:MAG: transposase [Bacteroidota bacterium]